MQSYEQQGKAVKVIFEDEARYGRINNISRCWVPKGSRAIVSQQMVREHTYAFSAICPHSGESDSIIAPLCNTAAFNELLHGISKAYAQEQIVMIVDGAGWHHSKGVRLPDTIELMRLPPYSPELNPVEHLWDYIREQKGFNNHCFSSIDALEEHLFEVLAQLQHQKPYIKSLCNFNWINYAS